METKKMLITELKAHEKNSYFFDDITGKEWTAFVESIDKDGIVTPILVGHYKGDNIIISGHQRVRAWKEAGKKDVPIDVNYKEIDDPDTMVLELIETNLKQRGNGNPNTLKMGRCVKELMRLYGIRRGNNQVFIDDGTEDDPDSNGNNFQFLSEEELADMVGLEIRTMNNYKRLADLPDAIQEMILDGKISPTSGYMLSSSLGGDNGELAEKLLNKIDPKKKYKGKDIEKLLAEVKDATAGTVNSDNTPSDGNNDDGEDDTSDNTESTAIPMDNEESISPAEMESENTDSPAANPSVDNASSQGDGTEQSSLADIEQHYQARIDELMNRNRELENEVAELRKQRDEAGIQAADLHSKLTVVENNYDALQNEMMTLIQDIEDKLESFGLTFDEDGNIVVIEDASSANEKEDVAAAGIASDGTESGETSSSDTAGEIENNTIPDQVKNLEPQDQQLVVEIQQRFRKLDASGRDEIKEFLGERGLLDLGKDEKEGMLSKMKHLLGEAA